ncbi:serine/threonine-protein kinase [Streptomyces sp. NPDC093261]|uniref:serine/threonine-protein kinase n=1 Tax=Streptomyces sp. NPDC093261 TaxID=3366037 RepID=UPI0038016680
MLLAGNTDPTAAERFRREAQTAARLNHSHVVAVYDAGVHDGRGFLGMELVEGHSLAEELSARGVLEPVRVASIARQAASGLASAHRLGVIHRDIKPGNLLLSADDSLKIGDFGIASFADDPSAALTATGQVLDTSTYLAPERALGNSAEPGTDIYALGCVLYELTTGHLPFQADSTLGVVYQHVDALPAPPMRLCPELPGATSDYLLRMLAKDPAGRPTAEQTAHWFAAQHRTPESVPPRAPAAPAAPITKTARMAAAPPPGRRSVRRVSARAGAAGAVALGTAAVVGLTMNSNSGQPTPVATTPHPPRLCPHPPQTQSPPHLPVRRQRLPPPQRQRPPPRRP